MKEPSQRQRRVAEQIKGIIADTLRRGHFDQEILFEHSTDISVVHVDASPDLKNAKVHVFIRNQESEPKAFLEALNNAAKEFQKELNRQLHLKFTPRLHFLEDKSLAASAAIDDLLSKLR